MALADIDIGVGPTLASRYQARIGAIVLFFLLCAFTLTTLDGGDIWPEIISAILLLLAALYFLLPPGAVKFKLQLPGYCLLGMSAWATLQTLFLSKQIVVDAWNGVLFWFTAAVIALVGASVFFRPEPAVHFRLIFANFASAVAVLDLAQQVTHASHFYWLIPSRYHLVFGPFAYWNHFAELMELSLPITLWLALSRPRLNLIYLLLSALQLCAVLTSGSRVGSGLVIAEVLVISFLALLRFRNKAILISVFAATLLTVLFAFAAGAGVAHDKSSQSEQLTARLDVTKSSWAMLAARPFTGWGQHAYAPVYRMFALHDDGAAVNGPRNDWLQFAVEGGIPFAALLAVIFIWSIRPAFQSGWGIGLIVIGLHAMLDYPFACLGVCGWYFALLSMLPYQRAFQELERDKPVRESIY